MLKIGGDLSSDAIFKKILSIGYEFECSHLAKLSLHSNRKTLVNSDLALRTLKEKIDRKSIKTTDDPRYLHVRIPIAKKQRRPDVMTEQEEEEEEDEFLKELMEEFSEDYEEDRKQQELAKKENESYLEYFYENRKTDNKDTIKFCITNDLANIPFNMMLKEKCKELTIPKNEMYFFKTQKGKLYDFKFCEEIATNEYCDSFSSVEFVVTYYTPKRDYENVIMDTFVDACSRIVDHMGDVTKIKGELLLHDNAKTHYTHPDKLGKDRCLYHKPGTNVFYMDTYDNEDIERIQGLGEAVMAPQMTFRSKAHDILEIMKEIVRNHGKVKKGKSQAETMDYELSVLEFIEEQVDALVKQHNETSERKIDTNTNIGKTFKVYWVLIFYKLNMFVLNHASIFSEDPDVKGYLKDFLTYSSRHSNAVLFERIKEIGKQHYGFDNSEKIYAFINKPSILANLYEKDEGEEDDEDDFDADGTYKYNYDAHKDELPEDDDNYGNPLFSMMSYFKYFETREADWLREAKYDIFSTSFELKNDEVILENRNFIYEINLFLRNNVKSNFRVRDLTFSNLKAIVNTYYGKKMKNMINFTTTAFRGRLTRRTELKSKGTHKMTAKVGNTAKYNVSKSNRKSKTNITLRNKKQSTPERLSVIVEEEA